MMRRLFLLNGLAILAVVSNHGAYWGLTALFWWADRYRPVTDLPNFDQMGSLSYYALITVIKLAEFSVPSFLFVSGFFLAYASRGNQSTLNWKMMEARIVNLLIPYFIWSILIILSEWLESCLHGCKTEPVTVYLTKLVLGQTTPAYYYIPLICQFYLLAPSLVRFAKTHWKLALIVTAIIQLTAKIFLYLRFFGMETPVTGFITAPQLFVNAIFYITLGVVVGFHFSEFKQWLIRIKWGSLVAVVTFGVLSIVEGEILYRLDLNRSGYAVLITTTLYAVSFILCFLAFENITIPFSKMFSELGNKSYGIYLLHPKSLEFGARVVYHLAPGLLPYQIIFQPVVILSGVGLPILLMSLVAKSPLRGAYRYLFG
ncbi:MAG: hypothetical protein DPW09_18505 [Anaerolineae bacterium]|nr:acyltransferase [Anaerolineales bacterium]MCQ3975437.1 hypothetical protein [Anaerolineae bacterium]